MTDTRAVMASRFSLRTRWLLGTVTASLLVAGTVAVAVFISKQPPAGLEGLERFTDLTRKHVDKRLTYPTKPPVGGDHASVFQNCGVYPNPIPDETATHSLEHGTVWLAYRPGVIKSDLKQMKAFITGREYALLSPYPGLESRFALVAWGARLKLEKLEMVKVKRFFEVFSPNKAAPESGGYCLGGTGRPDHVKD
jgi:Protein of unknown function (DUF3105)